MENKKSIRILTKILAISVSLVGTNAFSQTWLIDFGATNSWRGASQVGADANGNQWNSIVPYNYISGLKTIAGTASTIDYAPPTGIAVDSYNGPLGASVSNPLTTAQVDAVVIDSAALGILGGSKAAAADYMSSSGANRNFQLKWLNTSLTYDASFYGAHKFPTGGENTVVRAFSDGSYTNQVASVSMNVGGGGNYNFNTTVSLTNLRPTSTDGLGRQLSFQFGTPSGTNNGYLNAMSLYGYLGYRDGSTVTLSAGSSYVANGTYANSDVRSVDTVLGGGTTVNVNHASGIYYNSTLIMTNGGGTINAGTNFSAYALRGSGNLALGGGSQFSITHAGTYTGTLTLTNGNLNLTAANALGSGNLNLQGGTLQISDAAALGSGAVTVVGGTTTLNNASALSALTGNNAINLNGGGATLQVNGYGQVLNLGTGNVTVTGFNNLNAWSGGMKFDGVISGSGTMNWYGGGSLVLGGSNSFSGTMTASGNSGTLVLANLDALKSATLNKGANHTVSFGVVGNNTYNLSSLTGAGDINLGGNSLNITNGASYSGNLSGTGQLRLAGETTLSGSNSFSGGVEAVSGQLNINSASALGTGTLTLRNGAQFRNSSGAALTNSGNNAVILNGTNEFTGGILNLGTGTVTLEGTSRINTFTGNLTLGGNLTGSNSLAKDGIGTLTLAGSNAATSLVVVDYGTLALANTHALANANLYLYGTTADKKTTFAMAGNNNYHIGELSGASTGSLDLGGNTVTLGGSGRSGSFAGQITGTGGNLNKAGSGTVTLTGTSDYTGSTTVTAGKLVVNGTLTSSAVTVESGATLGGSGTVSALTVASGGTLAAGNSPGELTVTGNVIWSGGGSYDWEINSFPGTSGTNWDFLDIGGTLTIDAMSQNRFIIDVISLLANNGAGEATGFDAFTNYSFAIATAAGGISNFSSSYFNILTGSFANSVNPAGAASAGTWGVSQQGNNLMLNYTAASTASAGATAIPEPSSLALTVLGFGLLALRRRSRR
jgi:autotransporter-associated beta strand protein